jgi:hypothetical protein
VPHFGAKRLDAILNEDVQRLKARLEKKAPKTVNNVLTVLNTVLKTALAWEHEAPRLLAAYEALFT